MRRSANPRRRSAQPSKRAAPPALRLRGIAGDRSGERAGIGRYRIVARDLVDGRENAVQPRREHRRDFFRVIGQRLFEPCTVELEGAVALDRYAQVGKRARRAGWRVGHDDLAAKRGKFGAQRACAVIAGEVAGHRIGRRIELGGDLVQRAHDIGHRGGYGGLGVAEADDGCRTRVGPRQFKGQTRRGVGDRIARAATSKPVELVLRILRGCQQSRCIVARRPGEVREAGIGGIFGRFDDEPAVEALRPLHHQLRAGGGLRDIRGHARVLGVDRLGDVGQRRTCGNVDRDGAFGGIFGEGCIGRRAEPDRQLACADRVGGGSIGGSGQRLPLGELRDFQRVGTLARRADRRRDLCDRRIGNGRLGGKIARANPVAKRAGKGGEQAAQRRGERNLPIEHLGLAFEALLARFELRLRQVLGQRDHVDATARSQRARD